MVKVLGFGLVVPIFDLTREKLLTMPWFAFIYQKFLFFHEFAERLVAPYRAAAAAFVNGLRARARAYWARRPASARRKRSAEPRRDGAGARFRPIACRERTVGGTGAGSRFLAAYSQAGSRP